MWSRILPLSSFKHLLVPAAAFGLANLALAYISLGLRYLAVPRQGGGLAEVVGKPLFFVCIYILVSIFLVLPSAAALARVETSLLPEDEDTIVPVDRSFNGKVVSRAHGGTGVLGFWDALKGFDGEARRRLIKLYFKLVMISLAIGFAVGFVLVFEGIFILGKSEFKDAAEKGLGQIRDLKM